jgi:hypothetical protein
MKAVKPATRRAPGRSAGEVQAAVERFLEGSRKPALLEPGEPLLPLTKGNCVLELRNSRLTLHAWDERRNLARQIIDIREEQRGRLELVAARFPRKQGPLFLIDLARPASRDWERHGSRLVFRERFRQFLACEFPAWKLADITTEADLEHSLSPAFPRALLKKGASGLAAIGVGPDAVDPSAVLSFGLIWLDYLRRRERRAVIEGLVLFLPAGQERSTCLRLRFLDAGAARFEIFAYSEQDFSSRLDLRDFGNLETKLEICRAPSMVHREWLDHLLRVPGVEQVASHSGEISLRVCGLEFARTSGSEILFGLADRAMASENNLREIEQLARHLARLRSADAEPRGDFCLRSPEAWLESQVRGAIETIDASLVPQPIYGQVPAFAGGDRGVIDLLAVDRTGRLAVVELKASSDLHLPVQALDYWMRVNWHLDRQEFGPNGYFPGVALRRDAPRLLLVAPALEFHPTTESILSYFSPAIQVERIGLGLNWRTRLEVMFRLRGAERPQ